MCGLLNNAAAANPLELWYDRPAEQWVEALPIGNGSLGAMAYGGAQQCRYQFNIDTLWEGAPHDYAHAGAAEVLPEIRRLLFAGQQRAAEDLASERFMSVPLRQMAYQPCGDLLLEFADGDADAVEDYRRVLDLDTAIASQSWTVDGVTFTQQAFASAPARAIIVHVTSDAPGQLAFAARLTSPHAGARTAPYDDQTLLLTGAVAPADDRLARGQEENAMKLAAAVRVLDTDGSVSQSDNATHIAGATRATLALGAATNFVDWRTLDDARMHQLKLDLDALAGQDFDSLRDQHVADHQQLFRRVALDLGPLPTESLPTDQRVVQAREHADPALDALLFQFGRYLLIASSRPGSQAANLQGIWNDQLDPPWGSKYTTNINAEMNYWPAEVANLSECAEPLFDMLGEVAESGARTARVHYAAPGWVLHHNTDLWRGTAPINASNHGIWPTGGAWLCEHLWEHYLHSGDEQFLRDTAYPIMKSAAEFFAAYLIEDPRSDEHWLISGPSNSPEQGGLVMGPTMDHQIIRSLLANTIAAGEELGVDKDLRTKLQAVHDRIAPNQIGQRGQLQEWLEDRDDPNNRHRHVSHLWGLFPGSEISPDTPKLFDAARVSLTERGDGGTGWSRAWKINLWARLRDGDHAYLMLHELLQLTGSPLTDYKGGGVYPNLLDAHPPFQIDGNFGATSGMCEMLLQSHRTTAEGVRRIELLPALPAAWPTGRVRGLRARGGFEVSLAWANGQLQSAELHATRAGKCQLEYGGDVRELDLKAGESLPVADWAKK